MRFDRLRYSFIPVCLLTLALTLIRQQANCAAGEENSAKFFLPQNPVAAKYVLSRLSNQELIDAPRGEFVYSALLQRTGIAAKYRLEALDGLAALRHSDRLSQALLAITELDKQGGDATNSINDLGAIVVHFSPAELISNQPALRKIANDSQTPIARQIGWAGRILAEGVVDQSWREVLDKPDQLVDLLSAVPILPPPQLRELFYSPTKQLLGQSVSAAVLQAAAMALASIPNHQSETFELLAAHVEGKEETPGLVNALARIPSKQWLANAAPALAQRLLRYLNQTPTDARSSAEFTSTLQFAGELAAHLPETEAKMLTKTLRGLGPTLLSLRAIYEQMRFDKELLVVEAGKPVIITLQNDDAMPHNLALLAPGALKEIGTAAEKMPPEPDSQGRLYVPGSPKVLHATRLVPPGQKTQLSFTAPTETNDYPFVCTFPGHWLRMSGILTVVMDLDAYLAAHPISEQPKLNEWKVSDFQQELLQSQPARNLAAGKELFSKLACAQCHRLGTEGYAYGPELTDVFKRYNNDRAAVLQQILEPSLRIDPRYRNVNFNLDPAEPVTGMILKEDDQTVTVQTGPADSLVQVLKKSEIKSRRDQTSSPMPVGLLNSLSKTQVLDILSLLEAGGNVSSAQHHHPGNDAAATH
jgi:putative heme-binding domain-containing protein